MLKYLSIFFVIIITSPGCIFSKVQNFYKKIENKTHEQHSYGPIEFIYMINLDHRSEKLKETMEELKPFNISPFRFSAVNGWLIKNSTLQQLGIVFNETMRGGAMGTRFIWEDGKEYMSHEIIKDFGITYFAHCLSRGAIGVVMSHLSILKDAYESNYELIWVLEDDVVVIRDPIVLMDYIQELDSTVGRNNWDILFTDRDSRLNEETNVICCGVDYRPDADTRDQQKYMINQPISAHLRRIGSRFGAYSMIWTRHGIKKYLDYIEARGIFLPIDMDIYIAPGIQAYTVLSDVISNRISALTDNSVNFLQSKPTE